MPVDPGLDALHPTTPLRDVTLEVEAHVGEDGWDQQARLYALVPTADLVQREPALADQLREQLAATPDGLTPIEQESVPRDQGIEQLLEAIEWPEAVVGCALVVERVMLPPDAEADLPEDPDALLEAVAEHPQRQEVRIAAAVTRDGARHSTVRARGAEDAALLEGPDLVPSLLDHLHGTLT